MKSINQTKNLLIILFLFICLCKSDIISFGSGADGRLGVGSNSNELSPKTLTSIHSVFSQEIKRKIIKKISCGETHCLMLSEDGLLYSYGGNTYKQLGTENTTSSNKIQKVHSSLYGNLGGAKIIDIATSQYSNLILTHDRKVYCWGKNDQNECATGSTSTPINVTNVYKQADTVLVSNIYGAYGANFYFIRQNGDTFSTGDNTYGQRCATTFDAKLISKVNFVLVDTPKVIRISAGKNYVLAILSDGLYGCGNNENGELGFSIDSIVSNFRSMSYNRPYHFSGGHDHTLLMDSADNTLKGLGKNDKGQLGNGVTSGIGKAKVYTVNTGSISGKILFSFGARSQFSYAYDSNGGFHTWGNNDKGQLGLGSGTSTFDSPQFVSINFENLPSQFNGASDAMSILSTCSPSGRFSVDCLCDNIDEDVIVRSSRGNCNTTGCSIYMKVEYSPDVQQSNATVDLVLSDFDTTYKHVNLSNTYFQQTYYPNKPRNCSQYERLISTVMAKFQLAQGMVDLIAKPNEYVEQKCSKNVIDVLFTLRTLPCFTVPDYWLKDDFIDYVNNVPFITAGVSLVPGIKGKGFKFHTRYSRVEFYAGSKFKNEFTISFWARTYKLDKQTIFSLQNVNSTNTQVEVSFEPRLTLYVYGTKYQSATVGFPDTSSIHHYALSYDKAGNIRFFYDGKKETLFGTANVIFPKNSHVVIGQVYAPYDASNQIYKSGFSFSGILDDFKIFSKSVNDNLIQTFANDHDITSIWNCQGNGNDDLALNHGSPLSMNYVAGRCSFVGSINQFISIDPVSYTRFPASEFSISFKYSTTATEGTFFSYSSSSDANGISFGIFSGKFIARIGAAVIAIPVSNYAAGSLQFVAFTWNGYSGEFIMYGSNHLPIYVHPAPVGKGYILPRGGVWYFGQNQIKIAHYLDDSMKFSGQLDEIYLYNKVKEFGNCNGKFESDPSVCSGRGSCKKTTCDCNDGFYGSNCEFEYSCAGKSASADGTCSGKGTCIGPEKCLCIPGYISGDCSQKNQLYFFVKDMCTENCKMNMGFWHRCILYDGPSCFCGYDKDGITIQCTSTNEIENLKFKNQGLSGTIKSLTSYTSLKSLDLSDNPGITLSSEIRLLLSNNIEKINLDGIQGRYSSLVARFDSAPNKLTELRMSNVSLCGPYVWFPNISISTDFSNIWCNKELNTNCNDTMGLFDTYEILNGKEVVNTIDLKLSPFGYCLSGSVFSQSINCYSKVNDIIYETAPTNIDISNNPYIVTCNATFNTNNKSEIYIGWKFNKIQISKELIVFNLNAKSFLQTKEFTYVLPGENVTASLLTSSKYPLEVHKYLYCYIAPTKGIDLKIYPVISVGKEDEFNCSVPQSDKDNNNGIVLLLLLGYFRNEGFTKGENLYSVPALIYYFNSNTGILPSPAILTIGISTPVTIVPTQILIFGSYLERELEVLIKVNDTFHNTPKPYHVENGTMLIEAKSYTTNQNGKFNIWGQNAGLFQSLSSGSIFTDYSTLSAEIGYSIKFNSTGIFYVWIFGKSADSAGVHIGIDDKEIPSGKSLLMNSTSDFSWTNTLESKERAFINITSTGIHLLNVWVRDHDVTYQKILITKDQIYVPEVNISLEYSVSIDAFKWKTTLSLDQEGDYPTSLWYRLNRTSLLLKISNDFDLVSLKQIQIEDLHPRSMKYNTPVNVTFYTNISNFESKNVEYYVRTIQEGGGEGSSMLKRNGSEMSLLAVHNQPDQFIPLNTSILVKHKNSTEFKTLSENIYPIYLFADVTWNHHYPFVSALSDKTNININVTGQLPTILYFNEIYCEYKTYGGEIMSFTATRFSDAANDVGCTLDIPSQFSAVNSDYLLMGLMVNASSMKNKHKFYISNSVIHFVLKFPMPISQPILMDPIELNSTFLFNSTGRIISENAGLTFSPFLVAKQHDALKYIPIQVFFNQTNSGFGFKPIEYDPPYLPMEYFMQFNYIWGGKGFNYTSDSRFLSEKLTTVSEISFVNNPTPEATKIKFSFSKSLNPLFTFYFLDDRDGTIQYVNCSEPSTEVYANFNSSEEVHFGVSFKVQTNISQMVNIVPVKSELSFAALKLSPSFFSMDSSPNFIIKHNNSKSFIFPEKYRNHPYIISMMLQHPTAENFISSANCTINSIESTCGNYSIPPSFEGIKLYKPQFYLTDSNTKNTFLMNSTSSILAYQKGSVIDFAPLASLNRSYFIKMEFDNNILKHDTNLNSLSKEYYCRVNGSNIESQAVVDATKPNIIGCGIEYFGIDEIIVDMYLRVPDISNDSVLLNKRPITGYFANQGNISFTHTNQIQFFYSSRNTDPIYVTLNTSIPYSILNKVKCHANISNLVDNSPGYSSITEVVENNNNQSYVFKCVFNVHSTRPGLSEIGLQFTDVRIPFMYSANSLFITFAENTTISAKEPVASIFNATISLKLTTSFENVNYGDVKYYCIFGPENGDVNQNKTSANLTNSIFTCDLYSENIVTFLISVSMEVFGTQRVIVREPEQFRFMDEFFQPNYGIESGNETVIIKDYKGVVSNVTYSADPSLLFVCQKPGSDLVCTSPFVGGKVASFKAYSLNFTTTSEPLGIEFILYEKRTIVSLFPSVMPTITPNFEFVVTLNKAFTMLQGSVVIGLDDIKLTKYETAPYFQQSNVSSVISSLETGSYKVALYFKHPSALAVQNQFIFTQTETIEFVDNTGTISYFNSSNIQYINEEINVTISHSKNVADRFKKYVVCKLGSLVVQTINVTNGYQCSLKSETAGLENITLWYKNTDTKNSEFLLSTNSIPVIFVKKVNVSNIDPFASGISDIAQTFKVKANLQTDQLSDLYTKEASYQCENENSFTTATYINGIYSCDLSTNNQTSREVSISIYVVSKLTGNSLLLSQNAIPFLFYAQKEINIHPFIDTYTVSTEKNYDISLSLDYPFDKGLICIYTSSYEPQKESIARKIGNEIRCPISKKFFSSNTETIEVKFALNISSTLNQIHHIGKNSEFFTFFKIPISFENVQNLLNYQTIKNKNYLNFTIPNIPNRIYSMGFQSQEPNYDNSTDSGNACKFDQNSKPYCENVLLRPVINPAVYNFTFKIQHSMTGHQFNISVVPFIYYDLVPKINRLLPHFASIMDSYAKRKKYEFSLSSPFNDRFKYFCNVKFPSLEYFVDVTIAKNSSVLDCMVQNNFRNGNMSIELYFEAQNSTKVLFSDSKEILYHKTLTIDKRIGISDGFEVTIKFPIAIPSVFHSDYSYHLKYEYAGKMFDLSNCNETGTQMTCQFTNNSFSSNPAFIQMELYVNDEQVFSIIPIVQIIRLPTIQKVYPADVVILEEQYELIFIGTDFVQLPKGQNYQMMYSQMNYKYTTNCSVLSDTNLSCQSPKTPSAGNITLLISINDIDFHLLSYSLLAVSVNDVNGISNKVSSAHTENTISVPETPLSMELVGNHVFVDILFRKLDHKIRLSDDYFNIQIPATPVSGKNKLIATIPPLWDYDVEYPRVLKVEYTFDGIHYYMSNKVLKVIGIFEDYNKEINFKLSSIYMPIGLRASIIIENLPYSKNDLIVELHDIKNSSNVIHCPIQNDLFFSNTSMQSGNFSVNLYKVGQSIPLTLKYVEGYNFPLTGYRYFSYQFLNSSKNFFIGNNTEFIKGVENIRLQLQFQKVLDGSKMVIDQSISIVNNSHIQFQVNFPDMSIYQYYSTLICHRTECHEILKFSQTIFNLNQKINFLQSYSIASTKNNLQISPGEAYSFRDVEITIKFNNPPVDVSIIQNAIVKIKNPLFDITIDTKDQSLENSTNLKILISKFEDYKINHVFSYPLITTLLVSFTNGLEFAKTSLIISDKIEDILLFSVTPNVVHLRNQTLVIQGAGITNTTDCDFSVGSFSIFRGLGKLEENTLSCVIPKIVDYSLVSLTLINEYNDTSNSLNITILPEPIIKSFTPTSGLSMGSNLVTITGEFDRAPKITCKFDEFPCSEDCLFVNSTAIQCKVPAHPEGDSKLKISYNSQEYFPLNQTQIYNYISCSIGQTASNYSSPCYDCPVGYYKPVAGLFDCFICPKGTFTNGTGSTKCESCPVFTTSQTEGLTSITQCDCQPGYYRNPNNPNECLVCPDGAICGYNTTIPVAKPGRWFSKSLNNFVYYSCTPKEACPGGGELNCTNQYFGPLCARCKEGYYKEKAFCIACGSLVDTWIQFLAAIVVIIILGIIAVAFLKDEKLLEYDFKIIESPSDSEEDELSTINDIFDDLISIKRFKKKIWIAKKKGKKFSVKIIKGADKFSSKNINRLSSLVNVEEIEKMNQSKEMKEEAFKEEKKSTSKAKRLISASNSSHSNKTIVQVEENEETELREFQ
eukprot:gene3049-5221_t